MLVASPSSSGSTESSRHSSLSGGSSGYPFPLAGNTETPDPGLNPAGNDASMLPAATSVVPPLGQNTHGSQRVGSRY